MAVTTAQTFKVLAATMAMGAVPAHAPIGLLEDGEVSLNPNLERRLGIGYNYVRKYNMPTASLRCRYPVQEITAIEEALGQGAGTPPHEIVVNTASDKITLANCYISSLEIIGEQEGPIMCSIEWEAISWAAAEVGSYVSQVGIAASPYFATEAVVQVDPAGGVAYADIHNATWRISLRNTLERFRSNNEKTDTQLRWPDGIVELDSVVEFATTNFDFWSEGAANHSFHEDVVTANVSAQVVITDEWDASAITLTLNGGAQPSLAYNEKTMIAGSSGILYPALSFTGEGGILAVSEA